MAEFSFIHAADLHLDAPFRGLGLLSGRQGGASHDVPGGAPAEALKRATFLALERLTKVCIESGADFLLLAGDVYNSADSSLRARLALRDAFVRLEKAGVGVFLAHGNHDPLQAEQGAVPWPDNVHVFGSETACRLAFARGGGAPVALVHGVSHAGPAESRNLAATFKRKAPSLLEPDLFQIGLLHCALSGVSGGHDAYAPCTFADLAEAELDYWALGHVHSCRLFDRKGRALPPAMPGGRESGIAVSGQTATQTAARPDFRADIRPDFQADAQTTVQAQARPLLRPAAAYSGSLQGLHVNETGPHGCLLLRVDGRGRATATALPLAPVQWEHLRLGPELAGAADLPALESLLLERLEAFAPPRPGLSSPDSPGFAPESVAVRVTLAGQSPLHAELADPESAQELRLRLDRDLAASRVWIRDLDLRLEPVFDREAARLRPDLAGEVLRLAESLAAEDLDSIAAGALDPLFKRPRLRKDLAAPEEEELAALVDEAALLCLELLGPESLQENMRENAAEDGEDG